MMALSGILMALLSGSGREGAWIDISMTDGSVASLAIPHPICWRGDPQERAPCR